MGDYRKCNICHDYYDAYEEHYVMSIEKEETGYCRSSLRYDVCPSCAKVILTTINSVKRLNDPRPTDGKSGIIERLLDLL